MLFDILPHGSLETIPRGLPLQESEIVSASVINHLFRADRFSHFQYRSLGDITNPEGLRPLVFHGTTFYHLKGNGELKL